jgi:hypothetical protein
MLSEGELEEFLRPLLRRAQIIGHEHDADLQQLAHAGARDLLARLAAEGAVSSSPQENGDGPAQQVNKLPTPPQPDENRDGLFDPQRDISPG